MKVQVMHKPEVPLDEEGTLLMEMTQAALKAVERDCKPDHALSALAIALCTVARAMGVSEETLLHGVQEANKVVRDGHAVPLN